MKALTKILILAGCVAVWTHGASVRDVQWRCESKSCFLEFDFDPSMALPSFFQKFDAQKSELKVAFASTVTTSIPGEYSIQDQGTGILSVKLSQDQTPSGTPLLVYTWKVGKDISTSKNEVELLKGNLFRIKLPSRSPARQWSLKKAKPIKPALVSASVTPQKENKKLEAQKEPPKQESPKKELPKVEEPKVVVPVETPKVAQQVEVAPVMAVATQQKKGLLLDPSIAKVEWIRGYGIEQFAVEFEQPIAKIPRFEGDSVLVLSVDQAKMIPSTVVDGSQLVRSLRIAKGSLNTGDLRLSLRKKGLQLTVRGSRLILQSTVPANPRLETWVWSGSQLSSRIFQNKDTEEGFENLEQFAKGFQQKPMTTSQTFLLKRGARDLIVVAEKDGVLREGPKDGARVLQKLSFGTRLQSLEMPNNLYYKVKMGEVLGFVNRRDVSYPDELSPSQTEKMKELAAAKKDAEGAAGVDSLSGIGVVFEEEAADRISYQSFGRRDPFIQLKGVVDEGINIDGVELVGIIWEAEVPMVLLSDTRNPGVSYTLKEGDNVLNGKVLKITRDEVLFLINEVGVSRKYTMTLPDKYGGKK